MSALGAALVLVFAAVPTGTAQIQILPPCNTIEGTVTDVETGAPIPDVSVQGVPSSSTSALGSLLGSMPTDTTDGSGRYVLPIGGNGGTYELVAVDVQGRYTPELVLFVTVTCDAPPVIRDIAMTPVGSVPDLLPSEGSLIVDVIEFLHVSAGHPRPERPVAGVDVRISHPNGCAVFANAAMGTQTTDANGRAVFSNLREGATYCFALIAPAFSGHSQEEIAIPAAPTPATHTYEVYKITSSGSGTSTNYHIRDVEGSVNDRDSLENNPIDSATVTLTHPFYCPGGAAPPGLTEGTNAPVYVCSTETDATGEYSLESIRTDQDIDYVVHVEHEFFNPRTETHSIPRGGSTQSTMDIDIELTRAAAGAMGTVTDGGVGVAATLTFEGHFTRHTRIVTSSPGGSFFLGLSSDAYRVTVTDGSKTTHLCVSLRADSRDLGVIDLDDPSSQVTGTVLDGDGDPIGTTLPGLADATVRFSKPGPSGGTGSDDCYQYTDSAGGYDLHLPDAEYDLTIARKDWEGFAQEGVSVEGDAALEDVTLDRLTGTIGGTVTEMRFIDVPNPVGNLLFPNRPVPDLEVVCQGATTRPTVFISTASGQFTGEAPQDSGYRCRYLGDEFFFGQSGPNPFTLSSGGSQPAANLLLERRIWEYSGTIADRITGDGIEGARVCAVNLQDLGTGAVCSERTGEDGNYSVEVVYVNAPPAQVRTNGVTLLVDHPLYAPAVGVGLIGASASTTTEQDFHLIPEDPPHPDEIPGAVMGLVPDELNCAGHDHPVDWAQQLATDPTCGPLPEPSPALLPEIVNCAGHDDWVDWANQMVADPFCGQIGEVGPGLLPEPLNCGGHEDWDSWLQQTLADPTCEFETNGDGSD